MSADCEVAIVGGGPAGLAAARELRVNGITDVRVLERDWEAGGVPRHCGHPAFGLREFGWLMSGPRYAARMRARAGDVPVSTGTTVTALGPDGQLALAGTDGRQRLAARRVILATGVRETPRPPRLVSGDRPWGVLTTGALQQFVYLHNTKPCRRAVVIGSDLVSFSAILTMRHAGIEPVAIVEADTRIVARRPADTLTRAVFGVPVWTATRLAEIRGHERVEAVRLERAGESWEVACDGVVFTGGWVAETGIFQGGHLEWDPGSRGPVVDQVWRCSDPSYFAAGNVVHPVETAGVSMRDGRRVARLVARDLAGELPAPERRIPVTCPDPVTYAYPQVIALPDPGAVSRLAARVRRRTRGRIRLHINGRAVWSRRRTFQPERRIAIPLKGLTADTERVGITIDEGS